MVSPAVNEHAAIRIARVAELLDNARKQKSLSTEDIEDALEAIRFAAAVSAALAAELAPKIDAPKLSRRVNNLSLLLAVADGQGEAAIDALRSPLN